MYEFAAAEQNLPFAVAAVLLGALFLIELAGVVAGAGLNELADGAAADFNLGALGDFFDWLNVGKVPVIILAALFLAMFSIAGYLCQSVLLSLAGFMLPWPLATVPALVLALPATRHCGRILARCVPKDETAAVDLASLVGLSAVIVLGKATRGKPAQGKTRDKFGTTHYLMIEPDGPGEEFAAGQEVLLVRNDGHKFYAIAAPSSGPAL